MVSQLFGVTTHDPMTFAGVTLLLMVVTPAASYVPARLAMLLDPIDALRTD
jgi:ABC-type lipoprotein release transport system permease subunit